MKRTRAFTLIELLVVISIIGLLSSIVLASLNSARDKGRIAAGRQFEANAYHAAADSAAGIWDFDECSGTTAADRTGNGNNGSLVGSPSWSTDTQSGTGCSISLNGSTQYVNAGTSNAFNITGDITISLWIKKSTFTGTQGMVAKTNASLWNYDLYFNSGAPTKIDFYSDQTSPKFIRSTLGVTDSNWHHILATRSGTTVTIYIDSQVAGSGTMSGTIGSDSYNLLIGTESSGASRFNGLMDSVRIYDKSLTASEVGALYAAEKPRHEVAGI